MSEIQESFETDKSCPEGSQKMDTGLYRHEMPLYEADTVPNTQNYTGMFFRFATASGGYQPLHWHDSLEILYQLNGRTEIFIDGKKYEVPRKQFVVINPRRVHATYCHDDVSMFLYIHLNTDTMQRYMSRYSRYQIDCIPGKIPDDQFEEYISLCHLLEDLTRLYFDGVPAYEMEARGIILQIYARLLRCFSVVGDSDQYENDKQSMDRIHTILEYVEHHFMERLTLDDAAGQLGIGREYFCRFFKKNMGISFVRFVNEVRLAHIHDELKSSDRAVSEIAEENGFINQKLFYQMFRQMYGCRPLEVRKKKDVTENVRERSFAENE